ncbi:MAG: hypothetical protein K2X38_01640 [Gemmataceae bacterium]|nr:hypothetical protein [Gemmataceae bacterium]
MNIAELCSVLEEFSRSRPPGEDWASLVAGLRRFNELSVPEFVDALSKTAKPRRKNGKVEATAAKSLDEAKVAIAVSRVQPLLDRVTADTFEFSAVDAELAWFENELNRDEIFEVAKRIGATLSSKMSRKEAIGEIDRMIRGLRKSYERNSGRLLSNAVAGLGSGVFPGSHSA